MCVSAINDAFPVATASVISHAPVKHKKQAGKNSSKKHQPRADVLTSMALQADLTPLAESTSDLFTVGRFAVDEAAKAQPGWITPLTAAQMNALQLGDKVRKYGPTE